MIDLCYSNDTFLVWNTNDVYTLRIEHRIVGSLVGSLPSLPRQNQLLGLPLRLSEEEAHLLVTRGIARVVRQDELNETPDDAKCLKWRELNNDSLVQQSVSFHNEQLKRLHINQNKILEGKRKKHGSKNFDPEAVMAEEIKKIPKLEENAMIIQIFTRPHWKLSVVQVSVFPAGSSTIRFTVFQDLWSKGYYLTNGEKFGGDFLVYPGDPIMFHSHFIAVCVNEDDPLDVTFLCSKGRLGTGVKKTVLICSVSNGSVTYQSLQWSPM